MVCLLRLMLRALSADNDDLRQNGLRLKVAPHSRAEPQIPEPGAAT